MTTERAHAAMQLRQKPKDHLVRRLAFAATFTLGMALVNAYRNTNGTTDMVPPGKCIVDYSFVWSESINLWLR